MTATTVRTNKDNLKLNDLATKHNVKYAVQWSDNALMLGHGLEDKTGAVNWFSWLRDIKFRHGIPSLVEAINGEWVKVPLETR